MATTKTDDNRGKVVVLRLYIADNAPHSLRALANLREVLKEVAPERFTLEVVDTLAAPHRAVEEGVLVTPTLVRESEPRVLLTGELADRDLLQRLGLDRREEP